MINDLKNSGLKPATIKKLRTKKFTEKQTEKLTEKYSVPSYRFPYFDFKGKEIDYYRLKFLKAPTMFGQPIKMKYWQEHNSPPEPYLPPLVNWEALRKNKEPIVITEGEKKAALLCQYGIATIGLGGVWSFKSRKQGYQFLPTLDRIDWDGREAEIIFDNDVHENINVQHAMTVLAGELLKRGAYVYIKYLPENEIKMGIDDYMLNYKNKTEVVEAFEKLETEEFKSSQQLHQLNNEVFYLRSHNQYYVPESETFLAGPTQGANTVFATRNYIVTYGDRDRRVNAFKEWCEWPRRKELNRLVYEPDHLKIKPGEFNLYKGLAVEPEKGNVKPFLQLFNLVFGDLSKEHQQWVWQWLAYPLQNPGTKLYTAIVVASNKQGFGKSFIGQIMGKIYGDNYSEIDHAQLDEPFNRYAKYKQFILGDEVLDSGKRAKADRIKNMITQETILINDKNEKLLPLRDTINYYFTSNHKDALYITKDDRRFFIHYPKSETATNEFYETVDAWKNNGGPAALLHYLLTEVDCSNFNPHAAAPLTESKQETMYQGYSDVDRFCNDLELNPDIILNIQGIDIKQEIFTPKQLLEIFKYHYPDSRSTETALYKSLHNTTDLAFKPQVRTTAKGRQRLFAVKNSEKWHNEKPKEWSVHFDKHVKIKQPSRENKAIKKRSNVVKLPEKK